MSRYVLRFYKQGDMKYISHLDLLRLFKRSFKRSHISLLHSQGFNPHPKMSFVQPLSLGYTSRGEYLDFETDSSLAPEEVCTRLNETMPKGIGMIECRHFPPSKKTLAAVCQYASYEFTLPLLTAAPWSNAIFDFLSQDKIPEKKKQKNKEELIEIDIKPFIYSMEPIDPNKIDDKIISLTSIVKAGSNCNLNPELLFKSFCAFCRLDFDRENLGIERTQLYCGLGADGMPTPIFEAIEV